MCVSVEKSAHFWYTFLNMIEKEKLLQPNYTILGEGYQGKIEIDFAGHIPDDADL